VLRTVIDLNGHEEAARDLADGLLRARHDNGLQPEGAAILI
jgi:hypothetical protein